MNNVRLQIDGATVISHKAIFFFLWVACVFSPHWTCGLVAFVSGRIWSRVLRLLFSKASPWTSIVPHSYKGQMNKCNVSHWDFTTLYIICYGKLVIVCISFLNVFLLRKIQMNVKVCVYTRMSPVYSTADLIQVLETANIHVVPN